MAVVPPHGHAGRKFGCGYARQSLATLADGGAESPKETELRLLLVRDGLPRPVTQVQVGKRRIDMGWPDGKSAWSTTVRNTGQTRSGTPKISSGWNTLLHKAGPSCESAHGSCDTTVPAS